MLWAPWKVHHKFIMKWKRKLIFCGLLKSKFADFLSMSKSSFTVIYRNKIFTRNFTHNKQKKVLAIKFRQVQNGGSEVYNGFHQNKVQNRWDLSLKTSFSPSLCSVEPDTNYTVEMYWGLFIDFIFFWDSSNIFILKILYN